MLGYKAFFVVGSALLALTIGINGAAIESDSETEASQEHKFFQKLEDQEKYGLMVMAIYNHKYAEEQSTNVTGLFPTNPMPVPLSDTIPATLYAKMMNGKVPNNFMKKFVKWMKKEFKLTDESFNNFAKSDNFEKLCRDEEGTDCIEINNDAGGRCCPFG